MKTILILVIAFFAITAHTEEKSEQELLELRICQMSGALAYKAYMEGTYDAQNPDFEKLRYLVDYWGDMMVVKHDRKVAQKAVIYIAKRMQMTDMRQPWSGAAYEAMGEFVLMKCVQKAF